ncbi:hypothetical protein PSENEW3n2_00000655 [Picochlorum sp. SENEW3]|nr:hypothetical protein PSENEW3n2_00000655 [Picochlorum sp. SENEW3]WPT15576.1 hypothetical protein PSENEW3_00000655 [Picochlorum sp. SENEW3]
MPQFRNGLRHVTPEERLSAFLRAKRAISILSYAPPIRIPIPVTANGDANDGILSEILSDASLSVDASIQTGVYGSDIDEEEVQQEVTQPQGGPISAFVDNELPYGYLGTSLEEIFGNGTGAQGTEPGQRSITLPEFFRRLSNSIDNAPDEETDAIIIEAFTFLVDWSTRMRREHNFSFLNEEALQEIIDILSQ